MIQARLMGWFLSIVVLFGAVYGVYRYGRHIEGLERDKVSQAAIIEAQSEAANKLREAVEQHGKDKAIIADLRNKSRRMPITIQTCVSTETSDTGAASGVLHGDVQQAFDEFRQGVESLIFQCDLLNIDARQANKLN